MLCYTKPMQNEGPSIVTEGKIPKQSSKKTGRTTALKSPASRLLHTIRIQLPIIVAIIGSEYFLRHISDSSNIIVVVVLCIVIYIAQTAGMKQGLLSAGLVVLYDYYIIASSQSDNWLTLETLQRGSVIAVAFPILAFAIGRLKERNDALLLREKTARRKAEASERQLRFMAESMPQKLFMLNPHGEADYFNPQWKEYTNDLPEKGAGLNWSAFIHPDDRIENDELWQHSLKTGQPFQFEHRLRRNDGKYIWHITRAHALRDDTGEIIAWIGSTTDIEDIRRTRQLEASTSKLIRQRTQLMELNAAKDEFISIASHQLRTPATGVKQYIHMALEGYGGAVPPKLRVFLEKANNSNERQLSVINDLLQVAQMDAGKVVLRKEDIDTGRLIDDIIHEQGSKFSARRQTIRFKKPKAKVRVYADITKMRMVIENIIDNASKYTPPGKNILIRLTKSQGMARIAITDEGVGIAEEDIDKVFQKFLRLDNPMSTEVGGTGLGLYWVQKVVELHGGSLSVTSELGKGSTFTVSLPLS